MDAVRRMRPLLGTFVEVQVAGCRAAVAMEQAWEVLARAQTDWGVHDPASELSRLNAASARHGHVRMAVQPRTARLLRLAVGMMRRSAGAFDITVGGQLTEEGVLPDHGLRWQPRGQVNDIEVGLDWVGLRRPLRLTLDGVAKGFAVDLAVAALTRAGGESGWVNAGGDVRAFGCAVVPLHRRGPAGQLEPIGGLHRAAVASSFVQPAQVAGEAPDPRWAGRIVGPAAQPPAAGVWTVMARMAWRADALTKVAALCPATQRRERVAQLGGWLIDGQGAQLPQCLAEKGVQA